MFSGLHEVRARISPGCAEWSLLAPRRLPRSVVGRPCRDCVVELNFATVVVESSVPGGSVEVSSGFLEGVILGLNDVF